MFVLQTIGGILAFTYREEVSYLSAIDLVDNHRFAHARATAYDARVKTSARGGMRSRQAGPAGCGYVRTYIHA